MQSYFQKYPKTPIEECSKCREMLLNAIDNMPESSHKKFKYAHYQNLVYRTMLGVDAKKYKTMNNIKGCILETFCESQLKKCAWLFINIAMSILAGDTFVETKNKIKGVC